jgi:hypothetical protein
MQISAPAYLSLSLHQLENMELFFTTYESAKLTDIKSVHFQTRNIN